MIRTLLLASALAFATPALAQPQRPQAPAAQAAPFAADAVVQVNGMVCDFCAQAISKSFKRRAEVADIRVDLTAKVVSLDFKPGQTLDEATIRRIVTNAGYTVVTLRRTS
jgi:copper chaperone CopZ